MRPLVEAAYKKYYGKIKFVVVDVTDPKGSQLANQMQVYGIPAMFFVNSQGRLVDSYSGKLSGQDLEAKLQKIL